MKIALVAGEASGDAHGAALMQELQKKIPNILFFGLGGSKMKSTAQQTECNATEHLELGTWNLKLPLLCNGITDWIAEAGVVGLWDVLKKYGYFRKKFSALLKQLEQEKPEAIILIDYAGFNLRLAKAIRRRKLPIKIIKYISPQVWAWNRGRIPAMARNLDLMICIFPFEEKIYETSGLLTKFSGHPLVEKLIALQPKLQRKENLLGLFPGSRSREVHHIFPVMAAAAKRITTENPAVRCEAAAAIAAQADEMKAIAAKIGVLAELAADDAEQGVGGAQQRSVYGNTRAASTDATQLCAPAVELCKKSSITITVGEAHSLMQRATFALVCSGTATLEAAALGLPYALVYKATPLTAMVARRLIRIPYLGIVNILAGRLVVKEFLQADATPQALAKEATHFLKNPEAAQHLSQEVRSVAATLRSEGAYEKAAEVITETLKKRFTGMEAIEGIRKK